MPFLRRQEGYAKEGDPGIAAPKGVPVCAVQKMGRSETRYAQTAALLNHFLYCTNGGYTWELQKSKATPTSTQPVLPFWWPDYIRPIYKNRDTPHSLTNLRFPPYCLYWILARLCSLRGCLIVGLYFCTQISYIILCI